MSKLTPQQRYFLRELAKRTRTTGGWLTPDDFIGEAKREGKATNTAEVSRTGAKSVLRRLANRGLVEAVGDSSARWRITDAGRTALREEVSA